PVERRGAVPCRGGKGGSGATKLLDRYCWVLNGPERSGSRFVIPG
ncbi:hypothetical protein A2U01_0054632, partial [Trifolium medium]|nr:hypothetical protein [Trifolium medium]